MTLQQQIKKMIEEKGITVSALSRSSGISQARLSQWLNEKYPGDNKSIDHAMSALISLYRDRTSSPRPNIKFVQTNVSKNVFETATLCHLDGEIGVVTGKAGVGKTWALRQYEKMNPDVILIESDMGMTAKTLFADLARKLNLPVTGILHDVLEAVNSKLKDSGRFIIIDEAEHLPYRALDMLRRVHDKAGVGILLAGMPRLIHNLRGKKGEYAQLYSRVAMHCEVGDIQYEDAREIINGAIPGVNGMSEMIFDKCAGNARVLEKLLKRCMRLMAINNTHLNEQVVINASKALII